jgi:hypothetical protein
MCPGISSWPLVYSALDGALSPSRWNLAGQQTGGLVLPPSAGFLGSSDHKLRLSSVDLYVQAPEEELIGLRVDAEADFFVVVDLAAVN